MIINYDEYIKIVPKETAEFVNLVLKLFDKYICKEYAILVKDGNEETVTIEHLETKIFAILLGVKYYQNLNDSTRIILDSCGLKEEFINTLNIEKLKEIDVDYNNVFNKTANIFCQYKYYENYMYLLPERIIYNIYYAEKYYINQINYIFENDWRNIFSNQYSKLAIDIEENQKNMLEKEVYKDLPYDLINYLEKVASWFGWFSSNSKSEYNSEVIETFDDIALVSLIFAIYDIDNKITQFFANLGINESRVRSFFVKGKTGSPSLPPSCAAIIRQFLNKYINDGVNKEKERKNLTIENIINNIFDRDFTNSLVLEKLLYKYKVSINDFSDFENKLISFEKNDEILKRQKDIKNFYGEINREVIDFTEFVSRVHKVLKGYFANNQINQKYVRNETDITFLALFISSYFIPNDFINYFKDNGITKEKLMNKLNINITKDDILKVESDISIIIDNYKDIIFKYTSDRRKISINTVLYGLGNSEITNSCILMLARDINPNLRLTNNFINLITDYNRNQENIRKYQLEQKFFGDMNKETIKFIKHVSKVYQALENLTKTTQFSRDDLIEIAIYYKAINYNDEDLRFKFLGTLKNKQLTDILGINYSSDYEESIDIIYNYFGKYIFGGKNKDKKRYEITIKDIYTNIFNKDMNNSLALYKFLDDIDFCYEKFNSFDESFAQFEKDEHIIKVKNCFNYSNCGHYFDNLSKIYNHLCSISNDENFIYDINKDIDYIKDASRLLAFLLESNNEELDKYLSLLNKRRINIDNYLKYINISLEDFNNYQNKKIDYLTIYENFKEYKELSDHRNCTSNLVNYLFINKENNKYRYENFIKYLSESPEIVSREMGSGEEVIIPLTQDEQLNYLTTMPVSKLEYNLNSISKFGQELADHSIIIANEFVNIAIQDNGNNRVLDIKEEISKLMKKPSIFSRKIPVSEKIAHNKEILDNLTEILKENETRMIEVIEHFTYLKKLIAVYVYRLNNYIEELNHNLKNFENIENNKCQNLFEALDSNTIKQTLSAKLVDYQTSLNISLQQYNKINLILNNYLLNLSKTSTARNTTIPNLYIELSIRDSILLEQDSISDLNDINNLLSNIVKANNDLLDSNTFKVGKNNRNDFANKSLSESISEVLKAEHLLEQRDTYEIGDNKPYVKK